MASYSGNLTQLSELFGTADNTISETEDAEFLSASEAVKKLEEVTIRRTNKVVLNVDLVLLNH